MERRGLRRLSRKLRLWTICGRILRYVAYPARLQWLQKPSAANINIDNAVDGESLIALLHDELKEMGIISVGHRLSILRAVYDVKIKQDIPIEADHYIPHSKPNPTT